MYLPPRRMLQWLWSEASSSMSEFISLGHILIGGTPGSYVGSIFHVLRNFHHAECL